MYVTLEQFASRVLEVTTRYSLFNHVSYDPGNFIGKCSRYPDYGDFAETYSLRQYGNWWKLCEVNWQRSYRQADDDPLGVEDFVTVRFDYAVIPTRLFIYETYNPGSIVRIWGRQMKQKWVLMWEGEPQECPPQARKFQPDIFKVNCLIDTIRLDLNCSKLDHHTCFDAILLIGLSGPGSGFHLKCLSALNMSKIVTTPNEDIEKREHKHYFDDLPYEVIMHIFKFLDLKSLSKCACVSSQWNHLANDPHLYQNISFKSYWNIIDSTIFDYLEKRSKFLKKLDLSWCGKDDESFPRKLHQFLQQSCKNLSHISLGNASYFNGSHLAALCSSCLQLEELRLRNVFVSEIAFCHHQTLSKLNKLVTLDLYSTNISTDLLIPLLEVNPNLRYLNLDFCEEIVLDNVIEVISRYNRQLIGLSCWKVRGLTSYGINLLGECHHLEDLDLGWCLNVFPQEQCLEKLASGCKGLKRLILSAWRGLVDTMLYPLIEHCIRLEQLDLLSITGISSQFIETALNRLPNLKLLEISYCDSIPVEMVGQWKLAYPNVIIQKCVHSH